MEEVEAIKKRCKKGNKGILEDGVKLFVCPVCTRSFVVYDDMGWVYKRFVYKRNKENEGLFMCSYSCLRKYDKIFEKPAPKLDYEE